jgi:large subunit ribosomal protein L13e
MVKHNNMLPNLHFHKRGMLHGAFMGFKKVKCGFNQAPQKKARRLTRKAKAAAIAPRPTGGLLRPIVHGQTIKYNTKLRLGRGFTLEELKVSAQAGVL